ncbi:hypothetical protein GOP47_0024508 [Adiantum capillus-veneris]|uniref:Uncharacterized protein n=1 Tax=Adiantum capillus-veneris TaxID=13818 RepID=A0A9D4U293_ADICA|nr:hypothetical protein GOP47_0024508 [Adiantum capillus-veneris]
MEGAVRGKVAGVRETGGQEGDRGDGGLQGVLHKEGTGEYGEDEEHTGEAMAEAGAFDFFCGFDVQGRGGDVGGDAGDGDEGGRSELWGKDRAKRGDGGGAAKAGADAVLLSGAVVL